MYRITKNILPPDCPLHNQDGIAYEALALVSYLYLNREGIAIEKICFQCAHSTDNQLPWLHKISCPYKVKHFH